MILFWQFNIFSIQKQTFSFSLRFYLAKNNLKTDIILELMIIVEINK